MDIEQAVLCKAIEIGDLSPMLDARVRTVFFGDERHQAVFSWMLRFHETYAKSPTRDALKREFPAYQLIPTPEPYDYYIDQLRHQRDYSNVIEMLEGVREHVKNKKPRAAFQFLSSSLERVYAEVEVLTDEDFTQTTEERLAYYDSLRDHTGLRGIPTGFPTIDQVTSGLQKEQLITLIGVQKVGKSAILMVMMISAHKAGYRPLFVTFEMSNAEQAARHDAIRAGISYNRLLGGRLEPAERILLQRMMKEMAPRVPMIVVHDPSSTTTVTALAAKINQYHPDVVFVDGVYLMEPEIPGLDANSPQGLTSITRSMKRLAQRANVPIVQTTQALPSKYKPRRGLTLDAIGYTSSFGQDSDVIFGVEEIPEEKHQILLRIVAARNTEKKEVRLNWDWDHGDMSEMDTGSSRAADTSANDDDLA
jgi:replicative DNA helicase